MVPEDPLVVSISSNSLLHPEEIPRKTFPTARRGLDGDAVRRYLESLAADVSELLEREGQLRHRLADAERRAAEPEIDEEMLTRAVGSETARILQTAHQAANDVIASAEARAAQLIEASEGVAAERAAAADEEAAAILAGAEQEALRLAAATVEEATTLRDIAKHDADDLLAAAGEEAGAVLAATKQDCRQMVREARELRHRVLNDLAERRRALRVQLAQLRTGRDSLIEVVDAVGDVVDNVRERLATAEHEARLAAAQAGERVEHDEHGGDLPEQQQQQLYLPFGHEHETPTRESAGAGEPARAPGESEATPQPGDLVTSAASTSPPMPVGAPVEMLIEQPFEVEPALAADRTGRQPDESDLRMALALDEGIAAVGTDLTESPEEAAAVPTEPAAAVPPPRRSVGELFARLRAGRGSGGREPIATQTSTRSAIAEDREETGAGDLAPAPADPAVGADPGLVVPDPSAPVDGVLAAASSHEAALAELDDDPFGGGAETEYESDEEPAAGGQPAGGQPASDEVLVRSGQPASDEVLVSGVQPAIEEVLVSVDMPTSNDQPVSVDQLASDEQPVSDDHLASGEQLVSGGQLASGGQPAMDEESASDEVLAAAALSRRTELLAPVRTRLARALKRALQDDQNELLDSIRHASAEAGLDSLLPAGAHRMRYEQAACLALSDAWTIGRLFVTLEDSEQSSDGAEKLALAAEHAGRELGEQLALEVTELLRRRLSESIASGGGLRGPVHDMTAAAYREWKGSRIEAVAADFAVAAFSKGEVTAGEGMRMQWVVDDEGQPCPDCDDNSLAGPLPAGEVFPTGQSHPPVHAGCRCLLVPITQVVTVK